MSITSGGRGVSLNPSHPGKYSGTTAYSKAEKEVREAMKDPKFREKLQDTASRATKHLGSGTALERAASGATRALEVALERWCD